LDRVEEQLAALPVAAELRQAAVDGEGRRHPEWLQGEGPRARPARGVLLATAVVLALAGEAGVQAVAAVGGVLRQAWRASSVVEGLNSVLRMHQARHRRLTQGLLDLKRLYWNCREFRTGKGKKQTPYGRLGLALPTSDWWELPALPPTRLPARPPERCCPAATSWWSSSAISSGSGSAIRAVAVTMVQAR
jgi:hypothetical protein